MYRMLIAFQRSRPDSNARVGKTAVLAGLAQCLAAEGRAVWACRLRSDKTDEASADEDANLLLSLPGVQTPGHALTLKQLDQEIKKTGADLCLIEHASAPSIEEAADALGAKIVLAMRDPLSGAFAGVQATAQSLGEKLIGVVANFVPEKNLQRTLDAFGREGLSCLAALPEDRTLASPTLEQVIADLQAKVLLGNGSGQEPVEFPVIGPVSADAGRPYFYRWSDKTVVTRSDRTDLQLAALDTGLSHIILTGGVDPSPYLLDRASRQKMTVLLVAEETPAVMQRLERLYEGARFTGRRKIERAGELMKERLRRDMLPI
ncbi:MAG: DRTGG domain-containing protein [Dehalococcoidia bacterium]|nr:DRTGG domain-containing protein [Dehalococcoidia bacterium]